VTTAARLAPLADRFPTVGAVTIAVEVAKPDIIVIPGRVPSKSVVFGMKAPKLKFAAPVIVLPSKV